MADSQYSTTDPAILGACLESLQTVAHERLDRILDLESDVTTYRMLAASALDSVVALTKRHKQLAARIDALTDQIQQLMDAPCLACRRARLP